MRELCNKFICKTVGFPLFKSYDRILGWGYKTYSDGLMIDTFQAKKKKARGGTVRISGVDKIQIRGMSMNGDTPKTMEVLRKDEDWIISVTYQCVLERNSDTHIHAFD
ncbi:hypothetical protein [Fluviispira vulneris]|uniref:hypothetical protein n=1 Tax=Fluviispira vulneris TaxID=2763012 RepID=UPI001646B582|nr:hypothetical protein [Fluviispira vulneris]